MMNIKQNKGLFALLLLAVLTACTSEDNITTSKQLIEVGGDKLKIVINEEPFDVETTAQTRAGGVAQAIPAGTVDLGDGLEAEVSISQGTPAPKTRATVVSDGHYNIYAYDANTNQMLVGKKLSGNVVGGVFTPDAGSRLELEAGTYRFVCCTDGVSLDPTYGTGSIITPNINIKKEMIGATAPITLSGDDQQIVFLMYHREARVRFRITGYTNQLTNVQLVMDFGSTSNHYHYLTIPTGFQGPGTAMLGLVSDTYTMPSTRTQASVTYPLANEFLSDYKYLSWDENPWSGINLKISGTIYGKTVSKTVYCRFDHNTVLKDNGTYTINLKLKPTPALYLFQDGSCGALAEKGTRTAIGIVVKEKTATDQGTACALDILNYTWKNVDDHIEENISPSPKNMAEAAADMNGENWTYKANLQGTVRSNQATTYPAFYQAAHYTPSVSTSGIGRWYLPSYGELIKFVQVFQEGFTPTATESVAPHYDQMYTGFETKVRNAFTQASKPDIGSQFIISSTQIYGGTPSLGFRPTYINIWSGDQLYTGFCWNTMINGYIMPFVHF